MRASIGSAALFALAVSACVTVPASTPPAPSGPPRIPAAPLDLGGDWRNASVGTTLDRFQREVSSRYGAGLEIADVAADLRRQSFNCSAGRGEGAPGQVCRRTETISDCTHTWQVHLFDAADNVLARTRALYDRRCGGDGLLGGPT